MSTHPDAHLFRRPSQSASLRQRIWYFLKKSPDISFTLDELSKGCDGTKQMIYAACKALVKQGLAERTKNQINAPTKKDPSKKKEITAIRFIPEWSPSKKGTWVTPA